MRNHVTLLITHQSKGAYKDGGHGNKVYYLCRCGKKGLKKIEACSGFELFTSAIAVQRSNKLSKQANWEPVIIKIGHSLGLNLSQK